MAGIGVNVAGIGSTQIAKCAAGPYIATVQFGTLYCSAMGLNPASTYNLGLTQDGFMIGWSTMAELLNKTDHHGQGLIESFHQGSRMSINCVFHEWKNEEVSLVTPNSYVLPGSTQTSGTISYWTNGIVGSLGTDWAFSLNLSARASTPASVNGVTSITFPVVKCRSDYDIGMLFGPEHRVIPFMADAFLTYAANAAPTYACYAFSG
jgi:hypothetical protein